MQKLTAPLLALLCALPLGACLSAPAADTPSPASIHWAPIRFALPESYLPGPLIAEYAHGIVTVTVSNQPSSARADLSYLRREGSGLGDKPSYSLPAKSGQVVWSGPISAAAFIYEMRGGVQTFTEESGRLLWTDAASVPRPSLTLVRSSDGAFRLLDASGATLWAGSPSPKVGTSGGSLDRRFPVSLAWSQTFGTDGEVTLRDLQGHSLWSRHFARQPVILVRDGEHYERHALGESTAGLDQRLRLRLDVQPAQATASDERGRQLGSLPAELIRVHRDWGRDNFQVPFPTAPSRSRSLTLTFRDAAGGTLETV